MKIFVTLLALLMLLPASLFAGIIPRGNSSVLVTESYTVGPTTRRKLEVHNLGSSGLDGVEVRTGQSPTGVLDYSWLPLVGDTFTTHLGGISSSPGLPEFPVGGITYTYAGADQFSLTPDFAATGATHMTIQVRQGGTQLAQISVTLTNSVGSSQSVSGGRAQAGSVSPQIAPISNTGHLSLLNQSASSPGGTGLTIIDTLTGISHLTIPGIATGPVTIDPAFPVDISFSTDDPTLSAYQFNETDFLMAMSQPPAAGNQFTISDLIGLPEPMGIGMLALVGATALMRRRRTRSPALVTRSHQMGV